MKKHNPHKRYASGSCLMLAILLVTALTAVGQGKVMPKAAFDKILLIGDKALDRRAYREKSTSETLKDGKIIAEERRQTTTEKLPPDRSREVSIWIDGGKERKYEKITIGSRNWFREDDGPWKARAPGGSGDGVSPVIFVSYKNLGKSKLSDVKVTVYEKVEKIDEYGRDASRILVLQTEKYWIDDKGLYRQIIEETETIGTKDLIRLTTVYEYDPKITIEAPIK